MKLNRSEISHTLYVSVSSCDFCDKGIIVILPQRKTKYKQIIWMPPENI